MNAVDELTIKLDRAISAAMALTEQINNQYARKAQELPGSDAAHHAQAKQEMDRIVEKLRNTEEMLYHAQTARYHFRKCMTIIQETL